MNLLFSCKIPVQSHAILKNSKQIRRTRAGKTFLTSSTKAIKAKNDLVHTLKALRSRNQLQTISEPVIMKCTFVFDNYYTKKGHISKNLPDISNLYQLPEDCLEAAGIIENDRLIDGHDGSRRKPGNENLLIIELYSVENN